MSELTIRERQAGDVTVLDMSGRITIGEGSVALRSAVRRLLEEGKKNILLNLAGVSLDQAEGGVSDSHKLDVFANQPSQHLVEI